MAETAKRSELLFLYDTKMANPNGDPDENRPRIDPYSGRNLVTDYRLKRTIRDHLKNNGELIFVRQDLNKDGSYKTIEDLAEKYIRGGTVDKKKLIMDHIDVRLFGLLFAVKKINFKTIGPVQFSIGQSLNKVQELQIRNTRMVPTKEDARGGTFGEKNILRYSLIAFRGFLNQIAAEESNLSEQDVDKMILAAWHGTNNLSTTSKYGQASRMLLRVIYSHPQAFIGDFDRGLTIDKSTDLEDISDAGLDIACLLTKLEQNKSKIASIQYATHDGLIIKGGKSARAAIEDWSRSSGIKSTNVLAV